MNSLVDLSKLDPTIVLDIRYATADNFTHSAVYPPPSATCSLAYLVSDAARGLVAAHRYLHDHHSGLRIKVWDAYRPLHVQRLFWGLVPDTRFVADPAVGSKHNRGCAVDATIVDASGQNELDMGTGFDEFSERASVSHVDGLTAQQLQNRQLLWDAMHRAGFTVHPSEWWHFDFHGWESYPILDIPFDHL
eukprot:ANDGO_00426.mRNA.1 D-alanyl-D-alanine dipeptidase